MQIVIRDRVNQSEAISVKGQPIDISGYTGFTMSLVVHALAGTGPSMTVGFETSDNLDDWIGLTPGLTLAATGIDTDMIRITGGDVLLRYVRPAIASIGTNVVVNYTLTINLFLGA